MKLTVLFFLLLSVTSLSYSQNEPNEYDADTVAARTELMVNNKEWNKLIRYGEAAVDDGVESFLLRKRLGFAYYFTKNYFKAIPNFEKAISLGFGDAESYEYLYNSYFLTGRDVDKDFIFYKLPQGLRKRLKPLENSFIDNISAGYTQNYSNDFVKNNEADLYSPGYDYSEQVLNGGYYQITAGLSQMPVRFIRVNYIYNFKRIAYDKQIQFGVSPRFKDRYDQFQNRFYNNFDIRIANGLSISPAGHYLSIKDSTFYPDYNGTVTFPPEIKKENFDENFVLSLSASKYFSIYNFGLNGSFSYLNKSHQSQYGVFFKAYPLQKISFYSLTTVTFHNENHVTNAVISQSFGGRVKKIFYDAGIIFGKIKNYNEHNGYLVYNDPGIIKYKISANLNYNISYTLTGYFSYEFQQRERDIYFYHASNPTPYSSKTTYNTNSLFFGLKFTL